MSGKEIVKENIIKLFEELATLLELKGENPFKSQAYTNAARLLAQFEGDLSEAVQDRSLLDHKGIGKAIFEKISEIMETGKLTALEKIRAEIPSGLMEMLKIKGLGTQKIRTLYQELGIKDIVELEYACIENRLIDLPGFGKKTQEMIQEKIPYLKKIAGLLHCHTARVEAEKLLDFLRQDKSIIRVSLAGGLRRRSEVVEEIDLIASTDDPSALMEKFRQSPEIDKEITYVGEAEQELKRKKFSFFTESGMFVNIHVVPDEQFPYMLHEHSGSQAYQQAISDKAHRMGMKVCGFGLILDDHILPCKSEEDIFSTLELDYIEPELRENTGEIEAAAEQALPVLIEERDIRGIFHVHSHYSDGTTSLSGMVGAAERLGYQYIGISDHSQTAVYANGLTKEQIKKQHEEIDRLQKQYPSIHIFKGIESDILPDGTLDYDEGTLSSFDFVIASVHSNFNMSEKDMTWRILRAMRHPSVTILGHPTGRILLAREGYPLNLPEVIEAAREHKVVIELNASPYRLDLDWIHCKMAKMAGVRVSINPDAHGIEGLSNMRHGVGIARKGWLSKEDVLNTLPLNEITGYLKNK
ncbi:MAG: DNA polymerase/3'-5' exonuclease PolX [Nitrospiria bacterium]